MVNKLLYGTVDNHLPANHPSLDLRHFNNSIFVENQFNNPSTINRMTVKLKWTTCSILFFLLLLFGTVIDILKSPFMSCLANICESFRTCFFLCCYWWQIVVHVRYCWFHFYHREVMTLVIFENGTLCCFHVFPEQLFD